MSPSVSLTNAQRVSLRSIREIAGPDTRIGGAYSLERVKGHAVGASIAVEITTGIPGQKHDRLFVIEGGGCVAEVLR